MKTEEEHISSIIERFKEDTKNHTLKIIKDDGVHRHLRYDNNGSSCYHFNIVTWPGYLNISGDIDCLTFSRTEDMFKFFTHKRINPYYWGEKLQSPLRRGEHDSEYSSELFKGWMDDWFIDCTESELTPKEALTACKDFLTHKDYDSEHEALNIINEACESCCYGLDEKGEELLLEVNYEFFEDYESSDWKQYTHEYIWILEGIRTVCNLYWELKEK